MSVLSKGLLDLRLPGPAADAGNVFGPSVTITDIGPAPELTSTGAPMVESRPWPLAKSSAQVAKVDLWRPLLDAVSFFEHAKFYLIGGEHPDGDMWRYEAGGRFEALAQMKSGEWRSLEAKMKLNWARRKPLTARPASGKSPAGKPRRCIGIASPKRLFVEALDKALRPPQDPANLAALPAL